MGTLIRFLAGAVTMALVVVGLTLSGMWPRLASRLIDQRPTAVVLGASQIVVPAGAVVGVQVDRVIRDVAWAGSEWDERVPADRAPQRPEELVPYMEGLLISELMKSAGVRVLPLTPGTARLDRRDGVYYAPDAEGRFRFALDPSEIPHRSVRKLSETEIEILDTHGVNSIAAGAARARPFLAVGCMDLAASADAALYLAERGIHVYGPTDRFGYRLLGYRPHRPRAATIIGSAPIRPGQGATAVIGGQPVEIRAGETVVAQWTDRPYPYQYSDGPWRYFSELTSRFFFDLSLVRVRADTGEVEHVVKEARARGATIVAVRVGKATSMDEAVRDAAAVAAWLSENPRHRAILFHSAPYEPGYALFGKFPAQTTFGDLDPVFKGRYSLR